MEQPALRIRTAHVAVISLLWLACTPSTTTRVEKDDGEVARRSCDSYVERYQACLELSLGSKDKAAARAGELRASLDGAMARGEAVSVGQRCRRDSKSLPCGEKR